MFKFKTNGPAKVEAAFGLFTRAINDLEAAAETCKAEAAGLKLVAAEALAGVEARKVANQKAETAVANLKALIGE
jgi:hypothetical protein